MKLLSMLNTTARKKIPKYLPLLLIQRNEIKIINETIIPLSYINCDVREVHLNNCISHI